MKRYKCNISILTEFFVWQLRWKSFSMLYARNNKYIRATILLWNLKGWLEIPRHDAPTEQRAPRLLLKVKSDFSHKTPQAWYCLLPLFWQPLPSTLSAGFVSRCSKTLRWRSEQAGGVLTVSFLARGRGHFPSRLPWDKTPRMLALILSFSNTKPAKSFCANKFKVKSAKDS